MAEKKKILLVEDDLATIDVYKTGLEAAGFKVEPVGLGQEAVRKIQEAEKGESKKPDLILLDLILPDIEGAEVLKKIRKSPACKETKIFITTNYNNAELEKRGLFLKDEKYILKTDWPPSKLAELIKKELK